MKINTRIRYALRLMLELSNHFSESRPVHLKEISKSTNLSKQYLEQLIISLKNASLVRSISGRKGGFQLARSPEEIKILDIAEATIGPISLVDCIIDPNFCTNSPYCNCSLLWKLLNKKIKDTLRNCNLSDLNKSEWRKSIQEELNN